MLVLDECLSDHISFEVLSHPKCSGPFSGRDALPNSEVPHTPSYEKVQKQRTLPAARID